VACYYGCQMVRPYAESRPRPRSQSMDELLEAAGVPTVDWSLKTKVLRRVLDRTAHAVGVRLNYILLKRGRPQGRPGHRDRLPALQYNLDAYQSEIRRATGQRFDMPVLYFTQVLGWALGGDFKSLGFPAASPDAKPSPSGSPQPARRKRLMSDPTAPFASCVQPATAAPTSPPLWTSRHLPSLPARCPRRAFARLQDMCSDPAGAHPPGYPTTTI